MIASWLAGYGWVNDDGSNGAVPYECLPSKGLIAYDGETPVAAGFVYICGHSKLAFMDFVVGDPDASDIKKYKAVRLVINDIIEYVKDKFGGEGYIYTVSGNTTYQKIVQRQGFKVGEEKVTSYFYAFGAAADKVGFLDE